MARKLLLADDSTTIQRVVELMFSGEDIHVVAVSDGERAIARIPIERPDIILAGIGLPKRSGYDVAAFVKEHPELTHIPVLLLAGAFEPVDEARAATVRCDGVLVKPFEPQQVIARVRELVDGATGSPSLAAGGVPRLVERLSQVGAAPAEARAPQAAAPPTPDESLDRYFDQLHAAFTARDSAQAGAAALQVVAGTDADGSGEPNLPTIDEILRDASSIPPPAGAVSLARVPPLAPEPPDTTPTLTPAAACAATDHAGTGGSTTIAGPSSALFAGEQGEPGAGQADLDRSGSQPEVTDELVERVSRRVLECLAPDTARALVAELVSEVAGRLVREEIVRIRGK